MNRDEARKLLKNAIDNADLINGSPIKDSYEHFCNVAYIAESIAKCVGLNPDKAYIMGLLHDIGRTKNKNIRHSIIGYNILKNYGVSEDIARIAITHLFILKDGSNLINYFSDFKADELKFVQNYLSNIEYDDYDKLLQISDLIGGIPIMTIEERVFSVFCRYNQINNMSFCQQIKNLREYFENKMGTSIYEPLKDMMGKNTTDYEKEFITLIIDNSIMLEPISNNHIKAIVNLVNKNKDFFKKTLGWLPDGDYTEQDCETFIKNEIHSKKHISNFVIKYNNQIIGIIDFHDFNDNEANIGYWLDADMQGKGIMTKACQRLIEYGFKNIGLKKINLFCNLENTKSENIAKRLGMKFECIVPNYENLYGKMVDNKKYSITN